MNWHAISVEETLKELEGNIRGLSRETTQQRLAKYGVNELKEAKQKSPLGIFLRQFADVMIVVLIAAAVISGLIGDVKDTIVIAVIIVLNAIIGFVQEYRAEKAIQSLKKISAPKATVLRDNTIQVIAAADIVPGDIVLLEAGNIVPADLRIAETFSLKLDESSLTGESMAVDKTTAVLKEEAPPLGDRLNMAYKGTIVTNGRGKGIVIATGMQTELGKIAGMLQEAGSTTPLQKRMADFSKKLSIFILLLCGLIFLVGYLHGEDWVHMLLTALSLAVAAIPEALPAVITIALAIGAKRLVKNNALTRKLYAVETLGSVTYICSDKTGTLTQNKMTVQEKWSTPQASQLKNDTDGLLLLGALNHDVKENKDGEVAGDPTEIAVYQHAQQSQINIAVETKKFPRVEEIPFDSNRKLMTTIHQSGNKFLVVTKGAVESLLAVTDKKADEELIRKETDKLASKGMRVLAYGMRWLEQLPEKVSTETVEKELLFTGLIGMIDPPRAEAAAAIKECKSAGIIPVMITGDHPITAKVIAENLGIIQNEKDKMVTGSELSQMPEETFDLQVLDIKVYARVSPEQKLQIIKALQKSNQFAAMTGDGVNDAPSLKKANIGIAMGITGTDVSKEAAHMILLDDNFATIVKAIREGRRIYDNIRKFIKYIMTGNSAEIWAILLAPLVGLPVPLLPIHILWINLVTDGLPALALAAEPEEKNIMQRPPRKPDESIFSAGLGYHVIWVGILAGSLTVGTQAFEIYNDSAHWQTIVFTVLCLAQMWHVLAIRSETRSLFQQGLLSNRMLTGAVLLTFLLQVAIIYIPTLNEFFHTHPLTAFELLTAIGVSSIVFIAVEIEKMIKRKRRK